VTALATISLLAWIYLVFLHGGFWRDGERLAPVADAQGATPDVTVVVPARDEAAMIRPVMASLLAQDYAGRLRIVLVDDNSTDGTAAAARAVPDPQARLTVLAGAVRPAGWAGKLWAVHQGVAASDSALLLLTDADIVHDPAHVSALVAQAERTGADMVSEMVALNCDSLAERALVPAFVYLFALLYPFSRTNDPKSASAAAAGGTILIRRSALARIGGIAAISGALIDDVALARRVKPGGRIWLGHSRLARSIRPYPGFADIWRMVARSAYVQLKYSPLLLVLTTLGLGLVFLVPPAAALFGHAWLGLAGTGLAAWVLMAGSFVPTLRRFGLSPLWAPALPAIVCFYMAATMGAAFDHHRGRGVVWKDRAYTEHGA
jgi:hopene-associated glycosyltransferase HpnB